MAKKKSKPIEEEIIEEVKETEVAEEVAEEVVEQPIVEEPIEEEVIEVAEDKQNQFIFTQLKMINKISNPAKAKRLADRVLRNRKR